METPVEDALGLGERMAGVIRCDRLEDSRERVRLVLARLAGEAMQAFAALVKGDGVKPVLAPAFLDDGFGLAGRANEVLGVGCSSGHRRGSTLVTGVAKARPAEALCGVLPSYRSFAGASMGGVACPGFFVRRMARILRDHGGGSGAVVRNFLVGFCGVVPVEMVLWYGIFWLGSGVDPGGGFW